MRHAILLSALLAASCSSVRALYRAPGYDGAAADAIKRISVLAWTPATRAADAPIIARVAADIVKLRKDYLVQHSGRLERSWSEQCVEGREGVLSVYVLDAREAPGELALSVSVELHSCRDGTLVWRADAEVEADPADDDLGNMVGVYAQELGDDAKRIAAPAFLVLQEALETLPNPVLDEQAVLEKIELD